MAYLPSTQASKCFPANDELLGAGKSGAMPNLGEDEYRVLIALINTF